MLNLKKKSKTHATIEEIASLTIDEGINIEKWREIESSSEYLGFKILWILNLFLEGKQFPKGLLNQKQHWSYVYHIIKFMTSKNVLIMLLEINATLVFDTLLKLFSWPNLI